MLERLIGKRLTGLRICEPWNTPGTTTHERPPLFGAIAFEFEDMALVCKSMLRYFRAGEGSFLFGDDGHTRALGFHLTLCAQEEVASFLLTATCSNPLYAPEPATPHWFSLNNQGSRSEETYAHLHAALGHMVDAVHIHEMPAPGRPPYHALALAFCKCQHTLCITYREDLDGALQVAPIGWDYAMLQIVFDSPYGAFGWLSPRSPHAVVAEHRRWPTLEKYLQWLAFNAQRCKARTALDRCQRAGWERESQFEHGMRLKLEQHPHLKRRFLAIHYPVRGVHFDDHLNVVLQSLLLQYKISARKTRHDTCKCVLP